MARGKDQHRCVLCGKPKEDGRKIIVGLHGAVCSACVALCNQIIQTGEEPRASQAEAGLTRSDVRSELVKMAQELARPEHGQVILAEGNVSAREGETLWIKASGERMAEIGHGGFVQVAFIKVVQSLELSRPSDGELRTILNKARTDPGANNYPSTETFMHAWLLTLPNVRFVAHTHSMETLGLMCGPKARAFAEERYFPDQIVLCGPKSVFVPYCAPGFDLALSIRDACTAYTGESGLQPKTILLENHGLIALGKTPSECVSACLMMEKAAKVVSVAEDAHPLTPEEVEHIHNWTDEHYRQNKLWNE